MSGKSAKNTSILPVTKKVPISSSRLEKANGTSLIEAKKNVELLKSRWRAVKLHNERLYHEYQKLLKEHQSNGKFHPQLLEVGKNYQSAVLSSRSLRSEYREAVAFLTYLKKVKADPIARAKNILAGKRKKAERKSIVRFRSRVSTNRPHSK